MPLTPEAKTLLAETIRGTEQDPEKGLRARLLRAISDEAERQYRLSVPLAEAGLDELHRKRRERIEAWIDERARATKPKNKTELKATKDRLLLQTEKEAAATLINRLVFLRQLEARGLSKPAVLTGGWSSKGYREFREFSPGLVGDDSEGYATLLQLVFDELATDLPGLYGDVGLTKLFPILPATLRDVVERLDDPELLTAWTDDTTLGWVYQYWNDPDREALDAKLDAKKRIEPHEIASKTQMFTERYMVEWLLQNSLGLTWLAMCRKHGWRPDADAVLPVLEKRRAEWRKKREVGEVALDALMPIEGELEEHWKYYVPQPIPDDAVEKAPDSVRAIKLLDPACGSGHFLVIAFDLLIGLYREEARHLGRPATEKDIAESIVENNLHGIDIDPRAIQIAAAGLYLKARTVARAARPKRVNLVAPLLQLGNLPPDDPAVVGLMKDLKNEVGIPEELTKNLLTALAGVDYLGSLLKVDTAVEDAIRSVELEFERVRGQGDLFSGFPAQQVKLTVGEAKASILDKLEQFLAKHSKSQDLGLRLDGEQLAAGVRFVRIAKEGAYDLVVGNPPYLALSKADSVGYVASTYPRGANDLYAAFIERALQLVCVGGVVGLLTMRGWLFVGKGELRRWLVRECDLRTLGDVDRGAFEDVPDEVLATAMSIVRRVAPSGAVSVAIQPTPRDDRSRDSSRTARKRAALLTQTGRFDFDARAFKVITAEPILYWWSESRLAAYAAAVKLGDIATVREGLGTRNDSRYVRFWFEVLPERVSRPAFGQFKPEEERPWVPFIKGAQDRVWFEPFTHVVQWDRNGLQLATNKKSKFGRGADRYFTKGVAYSTIGASFSARLHRQASIFSDAGSSAFSSEPDAVVCVLNSSEARDTMQSLNPTLNFTNDDVERVSVMAVSDATAIVSTLEASFAAHEAAREVSPDFDRPAPSDWAYHSAWAQTAVDRPAGTPLPPRQPVSVEPAPNARLSYVLGQTFGRFAGLSVEGWPAGILFLCSEGGDSIDGPAGAPLEDVWRAIGPAIDPSSDVRTYLRRSFFDFHKKLYESRPIYLPFSSAKKSFVAYVWIHRFADDTLKVLLADYLIPTKRRLDGELDDLRTAKASGSDRGKAEKRFTEVQNLLKELNDFIARVTEIAEKGPPQPDDKTTPREVDPTPGFVMDLDDGVMVNSAALWSLLEPQWKDPKKWWKELANAQGKKDYDWSHLAARYFPGRVRKKCHDDPSLAVAHKCFWELHPAKAYTWELRLQDEIRSDFTIEEPGSNEARTKFLKERKREAAEILAKEMKRREKKAAMVEDDRDAGPLFDQDEDVDAEESDD